MLREPSLGLRALGLGSVMRSGCIGGAHGWGGPSKSPALETLCFQN